MSNSLILYHLIDIWFQIRKLQICYSPTEIKLKVEMI